MPAADDEDPPRVRSWITPKAVKGGASAIEGRGVHTAEAVTAGEVVAVKGGHIIDGATVAGLPEAIRDSAFPIAADCFLAARARLPTGIPFAEKPCANAATDQAGPGPSSDDAADSGSGQSP